MKMFQIIEKIFATEAGKYVFFCKNGKFYGKITAKV